MGRRGGGQATAASAPASVALLLAVLLVVVCDAMQVNIAGVKGSGQIQVQLVQTAEKTLDRLTPKPNLSFQPVTGSLQSKNQFYIEATDPNARFQTILGFGGAFTEAAAVNFAGLNPLLQDLILDAYWGENGIGYSIGRVHMNSCDFCVASYNFDNVTGDVGLKHFDTNVTHDQRHMIPFIKRANETFLKTRSNENSRGLKIFASPWSPPGWMKIPIPPHGAQTMDGSATPQGLKDQYFQSWALYYSKFLTAYKQQGVNLWGITVQNEPENAAEWEACVYNATAEKFFVETFLGPQIQQDHPEITLMAYDHNRDHVYDWAQVMYSDPSISQFVDGIAFHWYEGQYYHHLNLTHFIKPEKFLLATEACNGPGVILGDWARGESYGQDILADLQFWSVGWTDWNMVLNTIGGPNHVQNYCDAPVIGDLVNQSIYFQPTYYYMGQISKYVRPGSQRIQVRSQANLQDPSSAVPFVNNGNNLVTYQCQNSAQQRWGLDSSTNEIFLMNTQGGRYCWDLQDSNTADGANVFVWSCTGGLNQKWNFSAADGGYYGTITSNLDGKCVEIMDGSQDNGGNIQVSTCSGADNQLWFWDYQTNNIFSKIHGRFGVPSASSPPQMCATSGWTTFQSVGFLTPEKDAVVLVVMNSGNHQVPFSLLSDAYSGQEVVTSIPPHAIQTYSFPLKE